MNVYITDPFIRYLVGGKVFADHDHNATTVLVETRPVEKTQRVDVSQVSLVRSTQASLVSSSIHDHKNNESDSHSKTVYRSKFEAMNIYMLI